MLRYVGQITASGEISVGIEEIAAHHSFAKLACVGYSVEFHTEHYNEQPLCIRRAPSDRSLRPVCILTTSVLCA